MSYIKQEFVRRILVDEGQRLQKNQGIEIDRLLHFHTGRLENDRTITYISGDEMDGQLQFKHPDYERFLDIKHKRQSSKTNRFFNKNYPIHNRFVFGHYQSIASRLMFEFTDEMADSIKKDFNNGKEA